MLFLFLCSLTIMEGLILPCNLWSISLIVVTVVISLSMIVIGRA